MGVYKQKGKDGTTYGTWVIDRIILKKRLKIVSGSDDKRTVHRMNDMIDDLLSRGLTTHLKKLIEKKVSIGQLYELYLEGSLFNPNVDPSQVQDLRSILDEWMDTYSEWSEKTRLGNRQLVESMLSEMESEFPNPSVQDIPRILRRYRERREKEEKFRSFNMVRSVLVRFVRLRYGRTSELHVLTSDVEKIRERPKLVQTPKTPGQIERLCRSLPEKYRMMVWTMCTTGVGWDEYGKLVGRDDLKNPRIYIEGTKMDRVDGRRRRQVPYVYSPYPRQVSERRFRKKIKEVSEKLGMTDVRPYTFRKCYSNWLSDCGVPQWRIQMYMGHVPRTQTEKYQRSSDEDLWRWLKEDGEKLRNWIETERQKTGLKES